MNITIAYVLLIGCHCVVIVKMLVFSQICFSSVVLVIAYLVYQSIRWRLIVYTVLKVPGPKGHPFFHNLFEIIAGDTAHLFELFSSWNKKYGPVYVFSILGYPCVNITSPEEFEEVASTMRNINKSPIYLFFDLWLGAGLLTSSGSQWQQRRKILTPAFHFNILQQFIHIFNDETEKLVLKLKEETKKSSTNVIPLISRTTLKTIVETSCGTRLDENNERDKKYISSIHEMGKIVVYRLLRPWFYNQLIFHAFSYLGNKHKHLIKSMDEFTNGIIKERTKTFETFEVEGDSFNYSRRKKLAFLDLLLNAKFSEGTIDDVGIRDEVNTFTFEGHDTTSIAICFTLLMLATHREYQDSLYEEIIAVLGSEDKQPDQQDLNDLKLMERFIKESLRLFPSVPFISRTLDSDITLKGYLIPKEIPVNIWIYEIHRNPTHWPDPEKFDPDRFLPDNCVGRHPFAYVPFSAGPRNCIGQKFAILEIKAVLCGVIRNFVLQPVDTVDSLRFISDILLRTEGESIRIKFAPRDARNCENS